MNKSNIFFKKSIKSYLTINELHKLIISRYIYIYIIFNIFILSIFIQPISRAAIAKSGSVEFPNEKKIYFGPLLDNQKVTLRFYFSNLTPDIPLLMYNKAPTYINTNSPNSSGDDFFNFRLISPSKFPILLNENKSTDTISIDFTTEIQTDFGRKEAMLILGLTTTYDTLNTVICDTFFLIGKKTRLLLDGYDNILNFDSVFIDQQVPVLLEWKVKNTTVFPINAFKQNYELISQNLGNNEFFIEEKQFPLKFYPGNINVYRSWMFSYLPKDLLADTAIVSLLFYPDSTNNNIIDTVQVKLCGAGVQHNLKIIQANCDFISSTPDTIDFGNVELNKTRTASVVLKNIGNINYGLKNQNIYENFSDNPVNYFEINKEFLSDKENKYKLEINDTASFEINFTPDKKGMLTARYVITNDFQSRNIQSSSINNYQKTIILRGIGIAPEIKLLTDTINFGNVSYSNSENCPSIKDTVINIYNSGNAKLIIYDIYSENNLFQIEKTNFVIDENSTAKLKITFNATFPERIITSNLIFVTNDTKNPKKQIILIGNSIPPIEANLSISKTLKAKPGTLLTIPIILRNVDYNINQYIKTFDIILSYNPTLLEFVNITKLESASESCNVTSSIINRGEIEIISKDIYNSFKSIDTLLFITFKTFLGNHINTEIAIKKAEVGNGNCDDFIKLNIENGKYSIDSICGLNYKIQRDIENFEFNIIYTNNIIETYINIPYELPAKLKVINLFGEEIYSRNFSSVSGKIKNNIYLQNLTSGTYFINLTSGLFNKTIPLIITK